MVLYLSTCYRLLDIVYLDHLQGACHIHTSSHDMILFISWWLLDIIGSINNWKWSSQRTIIGLPAKMNAGIASLKLNKKEKVTKQSYLKFMSGGILTWPNQHDRMNMTKLWWTWLNLRQRRKLFIELDLKISKYYDNDQP